MCTTCLNKDIRRQKLKIKKVDDRKKQAAPVHDFCLTVTLINDTVVHDESKASFCDDIQVGSV